MSDHATTREMTLQEWMDQLPKFHAAYREYGALNLAIADYKTDNARLKFEIDTRWAPMVSKLQAQLAGARREIAGLRHS